MNLDDIKTQLLERLQDIWSKIQESNVYQTAREQFDLLPGHQQRWIKLGGISILVMIVLYYPYSDLSTSWEYMSDFENKKQLLTDLQKIRRTLTQSPEINSSFSPSVLERRMQELTESVGLTSEQVEPMQPISASAGPLLPKGFSFQGHSVTIKKMNLRQILDFGYQLQASIDNKAKMMGLDIKADPEDPHYYTATFRMMAFTLPPAPEEPAEAPIRGRRGRR